MDDLDHSIHIAENDWSCFYDESEEECNFPQASLAYPDESGLSDLEDSGNSRSGFGTHQQQTQRGPDVKPEWAESRAARESCTGSATLPEQLSQSGTGGPAQDAATLTKQVEKCVSCPGGNVANTAVVHLETARESANEKSDSRANTLQADLINVHGSGETKDEDAQTGSDLKPKSDPHSCEPAWLELNEPGAADGDARNIRPEKERWFVTVNDSPGGQPRRSPALKKKPKPKKACEESDAYSRAGESPSDCIIELNKNNHEDKLIFHLPHVSGNFAKDMQKENPAEPVMDRGRSESSSSASTSEDACTPSRLEQSDDSDDSAEFLSFHSSDSESCFSAAKSAEEPLGALRGQIMETQHRQSSVSLLCDSHEFRAESTDQASETYENALDRPAPSPEATQVPDDSCTSKTEPETPGPPMDLSASACSAGDQLCPLPAPDLLLTPSSEVDSPETYAKATGHPHSVYAISRFWDEMEKLTINDILQLRMGANSPPKQTVETETPSGEDILDTSDNTDSDYFTQPDESKPERSSCELYTSDFEEDYCQFVGTQRNPGPDPRNKSQQSDSSFSLHEDDCMSSEGRETPVPLVDFAGLCFDSQEIQTLQTMALLPMQMTESRYMDSAEALSTEDFSLFSLLASEESSPSLDEDTDLNASRLDALVPASVLSCSHLDAHYSLAFPEIFQCCFVEDGSNRELQCVTVYHPEYISAASPFDYTLCTIGEHTSASSLHCSVEKPIPIFSCCPPTVRELTFPKQQYAFLSANCEEVDALSPFRVVSHSFIHSRPHGSSAAAGGSSSWKGLLSWRKIRFHDKGSIWRRGSGAWMFPTESEETHAGKEEEKAVATVFSGGSICPASSHVFGELEEQQRIFKREGLFSRVKQSDMCLVCIAFASWVLKSSDPKAADAWKAALLANVSALSAIQYLRLYTKRKNPP
ncbi:dentin sialophosphoprotein [Cololabis saira]|uniref:dentin sialophosphoprotein n=1 Tax=Cololabis saira TaxID=129043 RepID=UPI002AD2813D|nr:dentin sialophosphoprotein [Cololabis saira]